MKRRLYPLAIPALLILALGACRPGAAEFSHAEAPNRLAVADASTQLSVHFIPGSARLTRHEARRLADLAVHGAITPSDRVTVAAAGSPALAQWRAAAVARVLLHYGIVARAEPIPGVAANHALIEIGRYVVTTPRCPNWSKNPAADFTNTTGSNFGCATATDLGAMVANPADLVTGEPLGPIPGRTAAAAVDRYLADKIALPSSSNALPGGGSSAAAPGTGSSSGGNQ